MEQDCQGQVLSAHAYGLEESPMLSTAFPSSFYMIWSAQLHRARLPQLPHLILATLLSSAFLGHTREAPPYLKPLHLLFSVKDALPYNTSMASPRRTPALLSGLRCSNQSIPTSNLHPFPCVLFHCRFPLLFHSYDTEHIYFFHAFTICFLPLRCRFMRTGTGFAFFLLNPSTLNTAWYTADSQ